MKHIDNIESTHQDGVSHLPVIVLHTTVGNSRSIFSSASSSLGNAEPKKVKMILISAKIFKK